MMTYDFFWNLKDYEPFTESKLNELSDTTIWRISTDLATILSNYEDKVCDAFVFWYELRVVIEEQIEKRFANGEV